MHALNLLLCSSPFVLYLESLLISTQGVLKNLNNFSGNFCGFTITFFREQVI